MSQPYKQDMTEDTFHPKAICLHWKTATQKFSKYAEGNKGLQIIANDL